MPHTRSAKKRLRQTEKRRLRNRAIKKTTKTYIKRFLAAIETGTFEEAEKEFRLAVKRLDQTAAKGVLHKNTVARKKSQLARALNQKQNAPAPAEEKGDSDDE